MVGGSPIIASTAVRPRLQSMCQLLLAFSRISPDNFKYGSCPHDRFEHREPPGHPL